MSKTATDVAVPDAILSGELAGDAKETAAVVVHSQSQDSDASGMQMLSDLGFITPVTSPATLRQAFAERQRIYAAVLDPTDYLYVVTYKEGRSTKQYITTSRADADKFAELTPSSQGVMAKPKKSGIVKLARALGIVAKREMSRGLPDDPKADYSYVMYTATHERTGTSEEGVGWCDKTERNGYITVHDIIATADTRAYNRAVLRLSGFGDVSADELVAGIVDGQDPPDYVPTPQAAVVKPHHPPPPATHPSVVDACRAWATVYANKEPAPESKQSGKTARELRAKARRGDAHSAKALALNGFTWHGAAQDRVGEETWSVPESDTPVRVSDLIEEDRPAAPPTETTAPNGKGWDLSGSGSDDAPQKAKASTQPAAAASPSASTEESPYEIPKPSPNAETITTKQAKIVSGILKEILGNDVPAIKKWLADHCHVDSSLNIRANQYEKTIATLKALAPNKEGEA